MMDKPVTIHLEGERAKKFLSKLADLADIATSIKTTAALFPKVEGIVAGKLHPALTAVGYACVLDDLAGDLMSLADGDDLKQAEREANNVY